MNTTTETMDHHHGRESVFKWLASGSVIEAIVSIAIIALGIVGLAGVNPMTMAAIATIITAAALLLEGGAFDTGMRGGAQAFQGNGLMSAQMLGAVAGVILGILALMGVVPVTLVAIAVLVFGVTFLFRGSNESQNASFAGPMDGQVLLGLSVAVLGLLAVIGISPVTLGLVGLLVLGVASLFGGVSRSRLIKTS